MCVFCAVVLNVRNSYLIGDARFSAEPREAGENNITEKLHVRSRSVSMYFGAVKYSAVSRELFSLRPGSVVPDYGLGG